MIIVTVPYMYGDECDRAAICDHQQLLYNKTKEVLARANSLVAEKTDPALKSCMVFGQISTCTQ